MSRRRNGRQRPRNGHVRREDRATQALGPVASGVPAHPSVIDALAVHGLPPDVLVQVVQIERQARWQYRRNLVTALPRVVLGRRVADGLHAVPFRLALVAFVGLILLRDVGVRGAVPVTLCGIVMGAGIGWVLMRDAGQRYGGKRNEDGGAV